MIWCNSSDTEADLACRAANKRLQRTYPSSSCKVNGFLLRNYWIIKKADTVYAFGKFGQNSHGLECVDGGTGWDVEMARLMHKPLYLKATMLSINKNDILKPWHEECMIMFSPVEQHHMVPFNDRWVQRQLTEK